MFISAVLQTVQKLNLIKVKLSLYTPWRSREDYKHDSLIPYFGIRWMSAVRFMRRPFHPWEKKTLTKS